MSYFYAILATIGWVWLGVSAAILPILLWRSRDRRGFDVVQSKQDPPR